MKFSNILILSAALLISNAKACRPECWAEKLGFPCCSTPDYEVYFTDDSGEWGVENGDWCGVLHYDPNAKGCGSTTETEPEQEKPQQKEKEKVPKCQFYNCGTITSIGEDGTLYSTNDHGKCYLDLNDKSCRREVEYYSKALLLGYKLCKEQHEDLVRDEDGLWAKEDGEWCGVQICPRCEVDNIDRYGLLWSVDGANGNKCVVDPEDTLFVNCKYTLQTRCRSAKIGYKCCQKTKEIVTLDSNGYWGIENGEWCGINNPFSCDYYKEKGYKCCDQIKVNFNKVNMTLDGMYYTVNKEVCGVSLEN